MRRPVRIAVVGAGPRALWAAEGLADAAPEAVVDVIDPRSPGVGAAYEPGQPAYLRLNVTSALVGTGLGSFDAWRRSHGEDGDLDPFPPRAVLGRFLGASWEALGRRSALRHHRATVTDVHPDEGGWRLSLDGHPADAPHDHVLLATGHEPRWPGAWAAEHPDSLAALPVDGLTPERVPAGRPVAIRGAALTFIDAALALTEGRGGHFGAGGYEASGAEPALRPFSHRGRFLEPKPQPGGALAGLDLAGPRAAGAAEIADQPGSVARVGTTLVATARAYLRVAGGAGDIQAVLAGTDGGDPVDDLRRSMAVVEGSERPHAAWAVGQAFRDLYPAIVASLSFGRCPAGDWATFALLARTLERVAFGPPPVNAAKILALVDAGVLAPPATTEPPAAARVDAVIAPPGVVAGSLAARLVADGVARVAPGRRGLDIGPDGALPGRRGLAAVGRVTEDVVIGNDTLSRSLHDVVPRWVQKVSCHA